MSNILNKLITTLAIIIVLPCLVLQRALCRAAALNKKLDYSCKKKRKK